MGEARETTRWRRGVKVPTGAMRRVIVAVLYGVL